MNGPHVHLDPVGGIAGDMFCAAMLDTFPALAAPFEQDLADAGVLAHVSVDQGRATANGIAANFLRVSPKAGEQRATGHYRDLRQRLLDGALDPLVTQVAVGIFDHLARAEAQVHQVAVERVHFHELADWDSIADIVGAASLIHRSAVDSWSCGMLPLGGGMVQTEHGRLPVPAPATTLLLRGFQFHDDGQTGERVTPTGAAILRYLMTDNLAGRPAGGLITSGTGCGSRRFDNVPNILRTLVLQPNRSGVDAGAGPGGLSIEQDTVSVLSFEVDDMSPEELATALERVREGEGVLDVGYQLRFGKKGRAQFSVQVLSRPHAASATIDRCLLETSTLGVRIDGQQRRVLARQTATTSVDGDAFPVKLARRPDGTITAKVEADSLHGVAGLARRREIGAAAAVAAAAAGADAAEPGRKRE